ncbi:hypothetical protein CSV78_10410 [Sporosarcina sp. P16a]|nr:hypothetical protein CSV78_10410 [Sporosarcina sp. P16a]PIC94216.1 hypothetical protein CSV70_00330 [Sporosarcina sp. P25]
MECEILLFLVLFKVKCRIDFETGYSGWKLVAETLIARDWRVGGATPGGSVRQVRQPRELATGWLTADAQESVPSEAQIPY